MNNLIDWGAGIINNIGWGQNYDINGFGKIYETTNFSETASIYTQTIFSVFTDSIKYTVDSIFLTINRFIK